MNTLELTDRRTFIGSSDAAVIIGVSPWKTEFALYQEKTGEYVEEVTPEKQKIFNRGKKFEPLILDMLVEELSGRGHDIEVITRNERLRDPEYPFIASESDMVLRIDGEVISAEAKSVNGFASKLWGKPETDEFPVYYQCQTMHDLMVKNRKKCVVAALIGTDDLRIHWIDRDDGIITYIRNQEIAFWQRILDRNPPDPATENDIKRLYQTDSGETLEADNELLGWYEQLTRIRQEVEQREAQIEVLSTDIKRRMGETALLTHNGYKLISWKSNRNSSKTDWKRAFYALAKDYAENSQDDIDAYIRTCTTTKPGARPFLIK